MPESVDIPDWIPSVSIRARFLGRAMRSTTVWLMIVRVCFNPRPVFRPGDASDCWCEKNDPILFQSAPGF